MLFVHRRLLIYTYIEFILNVQRRSGLVQEEVLFLYKTRARTHKRAQTVGREINLHFSFDATTFNHLENIEELWSHTDTHNLLIIYTVKKNNRKPGNLHSIYTVKQNNKKNRKPVNLHIKYTKDKSGHNSPQFTVMEGKQSHSFDFLKPVTR